MFSLKYVIYKLFLIINAETMQGENSFECYPFISMILGLDTHIIMNMVTKHDFHFASSHS